jgi:hypothetical protein
MARRTQTDEKVSYKLALAYHRGRNDNQFYWIVYSSGFGFIKSRSVTIGPRMKFEFKQRPFPLGNGEVDNDAPYYYTTTGCIGGVELIRNDEGVVVVDDFFQNVLILPEITETTHQSLMEQFKRWKEIKEEALSQS